MTKSAESVGSQGKYRKLFPIDCSSDNAAVINKPIGVKIKKTIEKISPAPKSLCISPFSFYDITPVIPKKPCVFDIEEDDIFGAPSPEPKANKIEALKLAGLYLDDFYANDRHYILIQHVEGIQLLKYIETAFGQLQLTDQITAFANILKSCIQALINLHKKIWLIVMHSLKISLKTIKALIVMPLILDLRILTQTNH